MRLQLFGFPFLPTHLRQPTAAYEIIRLGTDALAQKLRKT